MGVKPDRDAVHTAYSKFLISLKAKQLCRKPGFNRSEERDLAQDLTMSWVKAADKYDPAREASIDTYADRVINSAVKMILRARRAQKRAAGFTAKSLDSGHEELRGAVVPIGELLDGRGLERRGAARPSDAISALERKEAVELALAALSPSLAAIARRSANQSANAMAKEMGISRRQLDKAMKAIREKFQEFGLGGK
jgi:RNA polymerase sigma factor (sigma-70 family)